MSDDNIGQWVNGPVYAGQLIFNINGQMLPTSELDPEQLKQLRRRVIAALRKRRAFSGIPGAIGMGLMFGVIWKVVPEVVADAPPMLKDDPVQMALLTVILLLASVVVIWFSLRRHFGSWKRRQTRAVFELEGRLAVLDAELDLREGEDALTAKGFLRSLISSLRD